MPPYELIERLQLVHVAIAQPFPHFGKLGTYRALLIPVQPFHLQIALVPEKIDDLVNSLVVYGLYVAAICFGKHVWVVLSDVVIVDSIIDKGEGNELLLLKLLPLFLVSNVFHPPCLSGRVDDLGTLSCLNFLLRLYECRFASL